MTAFPSHPECGACGLCTAYDPQSVGMATVLHSGGDPGTQALLVLAQTPGRAEDRAGVPLVGPLGQRVTAVLDRLAAANPDLTIYRSNAVRCFVPPKTNIPQSALKCFALHTVPDLAAVLERHPRVTIFTLGAVAAQAATRHLIGEKLNLKQLLARHPIPVQDKDMAIVGTYLNWLDKTLAPAIAAHVGILTRHLRGELDSDPAPQLVSPEEFLT